MGLQGRGRGGGLTVGLDVAASLRLSPAAPACLTGSQPQGPPLVSGWPRHPSFVPDETPVSLARFTPPLWLVPLPSACRSPSSVPRAWQHRAYPARPPVPRAAVPDRSQHLPTEHAPSTGDGAVCAALRGALCLPARAEQRVMGHGLGRGQAAAGGHPGSWRACLTQPPSTHPARVDLSPQLCREFPVEPLHGCTCPPGLVWSGRKGAGSLGVSVGYPSGSVPGPHGAVCLLTLPWHLFIALLRAPLGAPQMLLLG